ncbi:hypothetical protein QJS66_21130 [Kocuria rhizophila]|nr:hypothetical protein QJS66_21130 [Kocuria rhizophila]
MKQATHAYAHLPGPEPATRLAGRQHLASGEHRAGSRGPHGARAAPR